MNPFKIAELVILNDNRRARVIERTGPRRWRVHTFDGQMMDVAQGDLARPGEDHEIALREENIRNWAMGGAGVVPGVGGPLAGDGQGNFSAVSASSSDDYSKEGSQLGASPAERQLMGVDD